MEYAEARNTKINFGKYKGQTLQTIANTMRGKAYLRLLRKQGTLPYIEEACVALGLSLSA
jgi:uncharacterized protein (DUF3820 family)